MKPLPPVTRMRTCRILPGGLHRHRAQVVRPLRLAPLRCRDTPAAATDPTSRAGGRQPGLRALDQQLPLHLGDGADDDEDKPTGRSAAMPARLTDTPLLGRIRESVIGEDQVMHGPYGPRRVTYAD